ncbi:MAG: hypothetical protein AB7I50_20080 [Vicinamibacterales bacterium]
MRYCILFTFLTSLSVYAQAPSTDDCLACHSDPDLKRANGSSVAVEPTRLAASVHGQLQLACVDCHADLATAELPHAEKLQPAQCVSCHDEPVARFAASVHGTAATQGRAVSCASCHGAHDILPSSEPTSRTYHLNLAGTCGTCHGESARDRMPGGDVLATFEDSIHGRALSRAGLLVAPTCATCHGAHDVAPSGDPASRVFRTNVPGTCGSCHEGVKRVFEASVHGQHLAKANPAAPVCVSCHTAHAIGDVQQTGFRTGVVDAACGSCHKESLATYRDTFHGQVTELGFSQVATCADCHSAHAQFPKMDARSTVSDENRLATCRACHPTANANFAQYDPHADAHDHERGAALYYTGRFMQVLLGGVFLFFGAHTTLWFARSFRARRERASAADGGGRDA